MNRIKLQLILAAFWFVSAYLAIDALFPWEWAWRCAWLNLIIGMLALLWITRTEFGDRMFYQGPQGEEDSWWPVRRYFVGYTCCHLLSGYHLVADALVGHI
jgi:hypothetical protein